LLNKLIVGRKPVVPAVKLSHRFERLRSHMLLIINLTMSMPEMKNGFATLQFHKGLSNCKLELHFLICQLDP